MKKALIIILALAVIAATLAGIIWLYNSFKTNSNNSNPDSSDGKDQANVENDSLYQAYLTDVLIPQYGLFEKEQTGTMYSGEDAWLNPQGILSATILDFDTDGETELLVCHTEQSKEREGHWDILLCMYENSNGEVQLADSMQLTAFSEDFDVDNWYSTGLSEQQWDLLGIHLHAILQNNHYYIMCENTASFRFFADGEWQGYWLLQYEGDKFQYVASFAQTQGGSSGFEYTGYQYKDGVLAKENIYYSEWDESVPLYDDYIEALTAFFAQYNIELNQEAIYGSSSSILSDQNEIIRIFGLENIYTGSDDNYEPPFTFRTTLTADDIPS